MSRAPLTREPATQADLLTQLAELEARAHKAAQVMYRRGYLAGHSAGSRNAKTTRGPYRKHRYDKEATDA